MMSNRSPEMTRRAFILATTVLAAGCSIRSGPGGRVRLAAGDPGGMYLAFAEILANRVHTRYPGVAVDVLPTEGSVENLARLRSGDVEWASHWPTSPSGIESPAPRKPHHTRWPGERGLSAGDRARLRCCATAFGPSGNAGLPRRSPIRRCGDQRGAVRGGRPSRRVDMLRYRLRDALARLDGR